MLLYSKETIHYYNWSLIIKQNKLSNIDEHDNILHITSPCLWHNFINCVRSEKNVYHILILNIFP